MQTTGDMRSQFIITTRAVMNTGAGNYSTRKEAEHPHTNKEDNKHTYKPQLLSLLSLPEPIYATLQNLIPKQPQTLW